MANPPIAEHFLYLYLIYFGNHFAFVVVERECMILGRVDGEVDVGDGLKEEGGKIWT